MNPDTGVLERLQPLKKEARRKNLVLHHVSLKGEYRLSADHLDALNRAGHCLWEPEYWALCRPDGSEPISPIPIP